MYLSLGLRYLSLGTRAPQFPCLLRERRSGKAAGGAPDRPSCPGRGSGGRTKLRRGGALA
eukprot:8823875-Pyramimonas_sp.AAC.1